MKLGMFMMPSHPPERSPFDADRWDLECIGLAEDLGFSEVWIGEHFSHQNKDGACGQIR